MEKTAWGKIGQYHITPKPLSALVHCDLAETASRLTEPIQAEAADIVIEGKAEKAEALYLPRIGRIGIAWGADADWADADSLEAGTRLWAEDPDEYASRN